MLSSLAVLEDERANRNGSIEAVVMMWVKQQSTEMGGVQLVRSSRQDKINTTTEQFNIYTSSEFPSSHHGHRKKEPLGEFVIGSS